jgi:anti-sigma factor RsiW
MSHASFETLSAFVDGALPELEAATVGSHVHSCSDCRSILDELRRLKDAVRSSAPPALASEAFRARLAGAASQSRRRRRTIGLGVAGGLGLALAVALIAIPIVRDRRAMAELIGDHVGITVTREEAFDITSADAGTLERWFTGKIDFSLHIPQLRQAKLVGARLCDIAGRHIPLASYELGTRRVSVFVERTGGNARSTACDEQVHGYTVCRRTVEGIEYLLVSDYPAVEARNILTAALEPDTQHH